VFRHADSGSFYENVCAAIPRVRDGRYYKFWVYILSSRTGTLATGKEDPADGETKSALAGHGGELGQGDQVSGTVPRENSLNQHGSAHILGISRLRAYGPRRANILAALRSK
jgi:hypothetical protein